MVEHVTGSGGTTVSGRFGARCADVGFPVPPVPLRLKLVRAVQHWTLFVQAAPPGHVPELAGWLARFGPLRIEFGSRDVLRADFDPLPREWATTYRDLDLVLLALTADGTATAHVAGERGAVAAFASRLLARKEMLLEIRPISHHPPLLTRLQDETIRAALASGYYDIPRPLNLHRLARNLGVSSASLSERLRRAEGRIIRQYGSGRGGDPWDDRTLFDPRPPPVEEPEDEKL